MFRSEPLFQLDYLPRLPSYFLSREVRKMNRMDIRVLKKTYPGR